MAPEQVKRRSVALLRGQGVGGVLVALLVGWAVAAGAVSAAPAGAASSSPATSDAAITAPAPSGTPAAAKATPLFRLADPRLDEVSGIAVGITSPGVVYVQNDSGDSARFFALDKQTGAVRAEYDVPGAHNLDWEDIAVAPDSRGVPSVWLADIGDNDSVRPQIQLYRVDEPHVDLSRTDVVSSSAPPQVWRLSYPDGPADAESLAVSPAGVPYLFTKSVLGRTSVYQAPTQPGPGVQTLTKIGAIQFAFTGTPSPFSVVGQLTATGADLSRNGRQLVVRTYSDAYLWTVPSGDLAAALQAAPVRVALPQQPQGEGVCFDGDRLLIDSEQVGSAAYAVALPPPPAQPSATTRAPPPSSAPVPAAPTTSTTSDSTNSWWWIAAFVVAVVVLGAVAARRQRR